MCEQQLDIHIQLSHLFYALIINNFILQNFRSHFLINRDSDQIDVRLSDNKIALPLIGVKINSRE